MACRASRVFEFNITLVESNPRIWRRLQVLDKYTFKDLHTAIQDAMGWRDKHLYSFRIGRDTIGNSLDDDDDDDDYDYHDDDKTIDSSKVRIKDYFLAPKDASVYEYDFGDCWRHKVLLSKILPEDPNIVYPRCIGGKRACPPEDCGGIQGYKELLETVKNPKHKEYKDMTEWLLQMYGRETFDPEKFNHFNVIFRGP